MADTAKAFNELMFPKPTKKAKQKRNRETDPEYVKWIHQWPCCSCRTTSRPIHAHHTNRRSQLGSDRSCVPLCYTCHNELHTKGVKTFVAKYRVNFEEIVSDLNLKFENGESYKRMY